MGFNHSMNIDAKFVQDIKFDAVWDALTPLADYFGWDQGEFLAEDLPGDATIDLKIEDGFVQGMDLYTCGDVGHSFNELVQDLAERLSAICKPGSIELRDHDTGDLDNAISRFWYGEPDEVREAQRIDAWDHAAELLRSVETPKVIIDFMAQIGGFDSTLAKDRATRAFDFLSQIGLNFSDCVKHFGVDKKTDPHAKAAVNLYARDGEIEIDDTTVLSEADNGCYVMAWVWVSNADLKS